LLDELDNISKIHYLERADIDVMMTDLAKQILIALHIERVNVWIFNQEKTAIISIGEYDGRTKKFKKNSTLQQKDFPIYFNALHENKIILAEDIYTHPLTKEFNEVYSKPHDIYSLLDIPIRISGELIGVMCYEKTGSQKKFSQSEISFALSVSLVLASNLETRHRRAAQDSLEKVLDEKDLLIREINHRVTNNFSILISLMRLSKIRASTSDAKTLLNEYEQRIFSMLKIHEMLNKNNQYAEINLADYLKELLTEYNETYPQINHHLKVDITAKDVVISTEKAIHLGLITSEILLNSIKYASAKTANYEVAISLKQLKNNLIELHIGDNGEGFDFKKENKKSTLGLSIIKDLANSLEFTTTFPTKNKAYYNFIFKI
ncbi:MAG: histidine kinase dimerization/phosphoacceptor domain -containing protein, partial [Bacteroidia bacterium]